MTTGSMVWLGVGVAALLALEAATVHWQIPWLDFLPEAIRRYYGP